MAIKGMEDIGIDISGQQSKTLDEFIGESFDTVVTVCDPAQGSCPFFPGAMRFIHKEFFRSLTISRFNGRGKERISQGEG